MSTTTVVVRGTMKPDGTLELEAPVALPPGPVQVTIQALPAPLSAGPGWWDVLQQIWREQAERGYQGRTREEIDADVQAMRDEWEERQQEIERIQEEAQRAREQSHLPEVGPQ